MKPGDWKNTLRDLSDPEPPVYVPKPKPRPRPEPRRTKSMPAPKFFMPAETMGDYENANGRRKSAPAKPKDGGLFPLDEEGTYGRPPAAPAPPAPPTPKRERKPKVYASYAVDQDCGVHAKKLAKVEKQRERELEEQRSRRRRNSFRRNVSASPSRAGSRAGSESRTERSSKSPDPYVRNIPIRRKSSVGSADGMASRKSSGGPDPHVKNIPIRRKSSVGSADGMASRKSSGGYSSSQRYSQSSSSSHKISGGIREESSSSYSSQRKTSGYSKYANDGLSNGVNGMSLDGLRKPNIDSWDSMGILGLTSKMWNATSKKQETFMSSTGLTLSEESSTYIM